MAIDTADTKRRQMPWHHNLKAQACVFCGRPGGHPDHVPPGSIFRGKHDDLITVPCCKACNNEASQLDDHFKIVVVAPLSIAGDEGRARLVASAARGAARNRTIRSRLSATFVKASEGGVGEMPSYSVESVGRRIARALYWHEFGDRLPPSLPISARRFPSVAWIPQGMSALLTRREVASGQFRYAFLRAPDDPSYSVWVLEFHSKTTVLVETNSNHASNQLFETTALKL